MKKIFWVVLILVALIAGCIAGYFLGFKKEQKVLNQKLSAIRPIRNYNPEYKLIDPLLLYLIPSNDQQTNLADLKSKITKIIDSDKQNGLSDASIYFSDLNRGRWIGVNQNDQYNPASMLKTTILVAVLKESEINPDILNRYLVYSKEIDAAVRQDRFDSLSELKIGQSYQVNDLINKMIIDSDNGATYLLLNNTDQSNIDSIFAALNLESPNKIGNSYTISPRQYSFFFRILYSATYLNDADSEKALNILSQATFKDGLTAGVPDSIDVAHKFGERVISQNGQAQQLELHDCGIVYYPKNPYLLCVMTRGSNLDNLKSVIKDISSAVYNNYLSLK